MATAAVAGVMVVRSRLFVAGVAIGLPCVIEGDILPGDFLMAAAALPVIMIGGQLVCVAVLAILIIGVIKRDVCPVGCVVAALAGAFIVRRWRFVPVAGQAVGEAIVVDIQHVPIFNIAVALGAKAGEMLFGRVGSVAGFTGGYILVFIGVL